MNNTYETIDNELTNNVGYILDKFNISLAIYNMYTVIACRTFP